MSAHEQPSDPAFAQVRLTGPPEAVNVLMEALGGVAEVIFGPATTEPDVRGDVTSTSRVVIYPQGQDPAGARVRLVTVQTALEVEAETCNGLAESAARCLENLPGVRRASGRVIADVALPAPQE